MSESTSASLRHWSAHLADDGRSTGSGPKPDFVLPEPGSVAGAWTATLTAEPDRPLLLDPGADPNRGGSGAWTTRGDFLRRTEVAAKRLRAAGLRPGDRVVVSGPSSVDLAVSHVSCLRLGLVVVPANGAYREAELAHLMADCTPRAAIVDQDGWTDLLSALSPDLLITTTDLAGLPEVGAADGERIVLDVAPPEAPAIIGYTSGTTGRPKGAVLTQANLLAGAEAVRVAWRWTAADRLILCLPLFHMHGLGVGLHGTLLAGGSAVLQDGFDPDLVLSAMVDNDATLFFGVPTMYHRLSGHRGVPALGRLRLCVAGSAPLSAELHRRLADTTGVSVLERYGMTETVMLVSNPYDGERRPGSVGIPLPGVEARLDPDSGEIQVRGPNVFAGYWGRPEATAESFVSDQDDGPAWFRTGDLGAVDADGYLSIIGRAKELIISGGFNVYPREVDDVLIKHPAVAEVAVAGVRSEEWGEEVVAWLVPVAGHECPSVEELREFARGHLAAYKLPRRAVAVDAIPRNALGKVVRHELLPPD